MSCYVVRCTSPGTFFLSGSTTVSDPVVLAQVGHTLSDNIRTLMETAHNAMAAWFGVEPNFVQFTGAMVESPNINRRTMSDAGVVTVHASGGGIAAHHWRLFYSRTSGIDPTDSGTYEDYKEVTTLAAPIVTDAVAEPGEPYYLKLVEYNEAGTLSAASSETRLTSNSPLGVIL